MLVWTYWPEPEGGAERQCRLLVDALTSHGHACVIFASRTGRRMAGGRSVAASVERFGLLCPLEKTIRRLLVPGDQAVFLHDLRFWLAVPLVWLSRLSFLLSLWRFASRYPVPVDVLHVHESGWLAGVGVWLARRWNIPVVVKEATRPPFAPISHGMFGRRRWDRYRREAQAYIAQTERVEEEMTRMGIASDRLHRLPNGVVCPVQRADPSATGVLYVGNLTQGAEWKAFDVLFEAWRQVVIQRPDSHLTFVGGGNAAPWKEWLGRQRMAHTVHFTGRVDDVDPYYARAGIFVLPSRVEGMSNALLEAQSWGVACIVSRIPGNVAVVQDKVNGWVVPVDDPKALAAAVIRLLDDSALRQRLGREARIMMAANYNIRAVADRLLRIYQRTQALETQA